MLPVSGGNREPHVRLVGAPLIFEGNGARIRREQEPDHRKIALACRDDLAWRMAEEQRHDLQCAGLADAVVAKHGCSIPRIDGCYSGAGDPLVGASIHKQRAAKAVCH
jgi:hypothetical protein